MVLSSDPFTLGVASGDPDPTSVVLWTRLAPDPLNGGGMPADDVAVTWEISDAAEFGAIVASGVETATASARSQRPRRRAARRRARGSIASVSAQYTSPVGLDASGARAAADSRRRRTSRSPVARTTPTASTPRIAISPSTNPDFVVWLGDYIYEDPGAPDADPAARVHLGPEPTTLEEYRNRYGRYKTDPHLQAAHVACPWFVIWDDHEVENNYAGARPAGSGRRSRRSRRADSRPTRRGGSTSRCASIRPSPPTRSTGSTATCIGARLIDLTLLDGRQYRSDQACGDVTLSLDPPCPEVVDPTRTMLGDEQETWLYETLGASTATWNVIGNQVVFADATLNGAVLNYDQWDGYPVQRERILQHLADNAVPNVVVLTGDIHLAAVAQLRAGDRATGTPVGAEFITTSISSEGLISDQFTDVLKSYPHLVDAELTHRGYVAAHGDARTVDRRVPHRRRRVTRRQRGHDARHLRRRSRHQHRHQGRPDPADARPPG